MYCPGLPDASNNEMVVDETAGLIPPGGGFRGSIALKTVTVASTAAPEERRSLSVTVMLNNPPDTKKRQRENFLIV